jgi:hypothetical protein
MVSYFIGGSIGSALGVWGWRLWRWTGVCSIGLVALAFAGVAYEVGRRHRVV